MMFRIGCIALLAAFAVPASAQQQEKDWDAVSESTPEDDLDCALLAAMIGGQASEADKVGVAAIMTYFLGRYEHATNHDMGIAMAQRLDTVKLTELAELNEKCLPRMTAMGERLGSMQEALEQLKSQPESE